MKKKILLGLLLICGIFALTGCKEEVEKAYKLEWNVPPGFSSKDGKLYYSSDYPIDTSNIVYGKEENTAIRADAGEVEIEIELKKNLQKVLAQEVEVEVTVFEEVELDGFDGLHVEADCELMGVEMTQICYIYDCDGATYSIAYTFMNDKDWEPLFRESVSSMRIVETEAETKKK